LEGVAADAIESGSGLDDPVYWLLDRERSDLVREELSSAADFVGNRRKKRTAGKESR
jgi:hypothetical protein